MTATFAATLFSHMPTLRAGWSCLAALATLAPVAAAQVQVDWVHDTRGVSIAVDGADNVFTADYEQNLGTEITVTKRDVNGNLLWVSEIDQTDNTKWERAAWVAVDSQGAVLVCGTLMSGFSNPVEAASLLLKFAPDGTPVYRIVYESGFDGSSTRKLLIDESDNAYVLGFGSGPSGIVTKIKKFTSAGTPVWSWFDTDGIGAPINFKFAPNGDMVVAARSIFGSINGYARVDRQGNRIWALPGVQSLTVGDIAGDALGNSYLVHGEFVINGGTVVKKLDAQGSLVWDNVYATAGFRVEVGSDNAPVVSGFPNSGTAGAAFFKLDPAGNLLWSNLDADGPLALLLHSQMLLDASGNAYLAASTLFAMAVCKVNADGSSAWTATTTGSNSAGIALGNTAGTVFVVGGNTARLLETAAPVGIAYCASNPNSTGVAATIGATGSNSISANDLVLVADDVPPGQFGVFFYGAAQTQVPFGNHGFLCVAQPIYRLLPRVSSTAGGRLVHALDVTAPSQSSAQITVGSTWHFQAWYRDAGFGFNLTNGYTVTFVP